MSGHAGTGTSPGATPSHYSKSQRVLACVLCQQRKVKCDRKFPCANCVKSNSQCVPSTLAKRQRKRRFPERELLERLRKYEGILRQNKISFEPLHKDAAKDTETLHTESAYNSDNDRHASVEPDYEPKNIWHVMSQGFRDSGDETDSSNDDARETAVRRAWEYSLDKMDDNLLFASRNVAVELSNLHPDPVEIFRLWQIYLENVDPLLKVTHTPSLQGRIIEAARNIGAIEPVLEALMFGIYSMAISSLSKEDCLTTFFCPKDDLLKRYQFGCQQALLGCGFWRSADRDCLTALYLYLVSVKPRAIAQSLSAMLAVAIRIAHRMGIHSESMLAKCSVIEAEMRRRLWWSLVVYDARIGEITALKNGPLNPAFDCNIPMNVNDSDLRPELKAPPIAQGQYSEAIFAVLRSELGNFTRNAGFYLDLVNPVFKSIARRNQGIATSEEDEIGTLEKMIEDRYFKFCDLENPLHFMSVWFTRAYLAKCRLIDHNSRCSSISSGRSEAQRDLATSFAIRMLECDIKIMTSPLTKGFRWMNHHHFPFPAYVQITQDLKRRPQSVQARRAWEVIDEDFEGWSPIRDSDSPFFKIFTGMILQAWEPRESSSNQVEDPVVMPKVVSSIKEAQAQAQNAEESWNSWSESPADSALDMEMDPIPFDVTVQSLPYSLDLQLDYAAMISQASSIYPGPPGSATSVADANIDQYRWNMFGTQQNWRHY